MAYIALVRLHELYDGYRQLVRLGGRELLLLQEQGRVYLLANQCPHRQAPLSRASVAGDLLRCPAHGIEFSLGSGRALNAPDCPGLTFYPLVYEGNTLGIEQP
ncbi:Rieske (2Fe-2S) protein [Gilvimarinus algae]|uniref:Rieske 2Fe-2S domain-containing protein n=1 Tax=Gilvimarinus algae TaxID=3058037 RepID=A0ABT8TDD0_9GAMM|nr:Rieske 2Fe-2S domain-containing protein [Gilvimarinus sp. SDUM040014]MDO3382109.1 Rieske 2Fe-2S domain-containing protein [Gilvimarinus sp. SDUM040014]